MDSRGHDLSERFLVFAVEILRLAGRLHRTVAGRHVGGQLIRCGTSAGSNYEEACAAESRADFVHKLQVVLKELRETFFWLRLIRRANLLPAADGPLLSLLREATELKNIIAKSIVTAKKKR